MPTAENLDKVLEEHITLNLIIIAVGCFLEFFGVCIFLGGWGGWGGCDLCVVLGI